MVHFAALKSVPDGEADPVGYHRANCTGLINIVEAMRETDVPAIVFSSSAAVYGEAETMPLTEDSPCVPASTYGATKLFGEDFLTRVDSGASRVQDRDPALFQPRGRPSLGSDRRGSQRAAQATWSRSSRGWPAARVG